MKRTTQGVLGVVAAQTLLGTLGICVIESNADPLSVTFYRCLIGGFALAAYLMLKGYFLRIWQLPGKVLALAILSGVLMVGNWVLFFSAIERTGIAVATVVFHLQPFMVVILGAVIFRERLHIATFAWIALALIGLTLTTDFADHRTLAERSYLLGLACAVGGAFLYSLVTIIAKGLSGIQAPQLAFVQCFCGTLLLATVEPLRPLQVSASQWGWFSLIGLVHTGGVYVLLYNALPKLGTPLAAVLLFFYPASAIVADATVYSHRFDPTQYVGFATIFFASLGVIVKWGVRRALPVPAEQPFQSS